MKRDPVEVTRELMAKRYPRAVCAFCAGSVMRGEGTEYSDIDLVVVFEKLDCAYREAFVFEEWPVEAFVHDPETLASYLESDAEGGVPSILRMVWEGVVVPKALPLSDALKKSAHALLERGPPQLNTEELDAKRYFVTDLLDDLRAPRSVFEARATGARLYEALADLIFRARGEWSSTGKTISRKLTSPAYDLAFERLFVAGDPGPVIALAEAELKPYGGPLFDGYLRRAPAGRRLRALPVLRTSRCELRLPKATDAKSLVDFFQRNCEAFGPIGSFNTEFLDEQHWVEFAAQSLREYQAETALRLIVTPIGQADKVIATINFSQVFRRSFQACYLGYNMDAAHQGQGLMTESLTAAIDYIFSVWRLHRIMANYQPHNAASARVLEKLGFKIEGQAAQYLKLNGAWRDHVLTSLINSNSE